MATVTLIPNAAGDLTECLPNPVVANYLNVDESPADDDATYVSGDIGLGEGVPSRDLYRDTDPTHAVPDGATGISITVYTRNRSTLNTKRANFVIAIKISGGWYGQAITAPSTTWTDANKTWATNPFTGLAWTPAEINALQLGHSITPNSGLYTGLCTYCRAIVTFTPGAAGLASRRLLVGVGL